MPSSASRAGRRPITPSPRRRGSGPAAARLGALLLLWLVAAPGCSRAPRVRVVLITLDTLRYDAFDPGAGASGAMPRLAERARRGTVFSRFYAASSSTQPTHASLFTGLHPWEHGVVRNGLVLGDRHRTVAEVLQQAGFETRAVVASFPVTARFGFSQGFDAFEERFDARLASGTDSVWEKRWEVPGGAFFSMADSVTRLALAALDGASGDRQFHWFHYFDPHAPYGASLGTPLKKPEIVRQARRGEAELREAVARARSLYRADVGFLDRSLDRVLARLEADAGEFETHVLLASDHGESLGEDGWIGHGWRVSPEQIHVPAIALSPALEPGARDDVCGSVDVAATLLAFAGISAAEHGIGGRDLTRAGAPGGAVGMRRPARTRSVQQLRGPVALEPLLFYAVDERGAVATGNGAGLNGAPSGGALAAERALARFRDFEQRLAAASAEELLDPETQRALEALGYGT